MDYVTVHPPPWVPPTGIPLCFAHFLIMGQVALCWFVCAPLLAKVKRRTGEMAFGTAFNRLVTINPLRMATSITNIWSMGAAESRVERASAARRLGEERTAIAVADLVARLDDPSLEVREEAAIALGSIASDDAIDALIARLEDPACDLVPEIARALRHEISSASMEVVLRRITLPIAELLPQRGNRIGDAQRKRIEAVLIRLLPAADVVSAGEIVRTLGAVGFREVSGVALLAYLRAARDAKVVLACSEALVRLEEFAAAAELVDRATATSDRRYRRALIVNIGDLIGEPGGFYRLLSQEERNPGSRVEEMLAQVARAVAHVCHARPSRREDGKKIEEMVRALDISYMEKRHRECVRQLFEIGTFVVGIELEMVAPADADAMEAWIAAVVAKNLRAGVGMRYLQRMREAMERRDGGAPDGNGVLLGIYLLGRWSEVYLGA
jgi:hypothetical protein